MYLKNMLFLIAKEYLSDLRKTNHFLLTSSTYFTPGCIFFFLIVMYGIKWHSSLHIIINIKMSDEF